MFVRYSYISFIHCLIGVIAVQTFAILLGNYKIAVVTNSFEAASIITPLFITISEMKSTTLEVKAVSVLFICSAVSLISGLTIYLLGAFKIASIVQNIPLPVRSGVFASIGYFWYI